jgi:hypothetical protein
MLPVARQKARDINRETEPPPVLPELGLRISRTFVIGPHAHETIPTDHDPDLCRRTLPVRHA